MSPLISIESLSVAFNGVMVLRGVDLKLQKGEALASSASPGPASR